MTDRDLTPEEARAEVAAFMGPRWDCGALIVGASTRLVIASREAGRGASVEGRGPTYRAAVSALKQAWRDAVRPWMEAAIDAKLDTADVDGYAPNERVIARVLGEDSNG